MNIPGPAGRGAEEFMQKMKTDGTGTAGESGSVYGLGKKTAKTLDEIGSMLGLPESA